MKTNRLEKLQFDGDNYILYAPDSLNYITEEILLYTNQKIKELFNFFEIKSFRKIQINLFDNKDKFREFIISLRNDKNSLPTYAISTYDRGMVNAYIDPNIDKGTALYNKKITMISHELFHIIYMEKMLKNDYSKRIVWLDEGLAQYFSGERDMLKFNEYFLKTLKNTKIRPDMNSLKHGTSFYNESYNGYDLSYLCIKYLFEIYGIKKMYEILLDYDLSIKIGKDILNKMFDYYENKYGEK